MQPIIDKIRLLAITLTMAFLAAACSSDEPEPEDEVEKVPRTVLIYMVADNSLGSASMDTDDLYEMETAVRYYGLNGCRVLVYHHGYNLPPVLMELTINGFVDLKTYDYTSQEYSVDVSRMQAVFADVKKQAPAEKYGLVLWSHANGWIETATSRSRAFGDDRGYNMSIPSLAKALTGQGFDYVYFDCCHTMTVEVAYELRRCVDYMVGSVIELPAAGMNYTDNLPLLIGGTEANLIQAATNTYNLYNNQSGSNRTCCMSVIRTAALDSLALVTRGIMQKGYLPPDSRAGVQMFMVSNCTLFDFYHYISQLKDVTDSDLAELQQSLEAVVLYKANTPTIWERIRINHHCGLGSWVPLTADDLTYKGYNNLQWYTDVMRYCNL